MGPSEGAEVIRGGKGLVQHLDVMQLLPEHEAVADVYHDYAGRFLHEASFCRQADAVLQSITRAQCRCEWRKRRRDAATRVRVATLRGVSPTLVAQVLLESRTWSYYQFTRQSPPHPPCIRRRSVGTSRSCGYCMGRARTSGI